MAHVNKKPLARNGNLVQTKKSRPRTNYEWENYLEKNPIEKIEKKSTKQSEIAAYEQKTTNKRSNFCSNTVFSLYFKIRAKKFTPQDHSLFRSISCFGVTKSNDPI